MTDEQKQALLVQSWQMHDLIEQQYLADSAAKGDELWLDKQRLLLADMALHLLQTALNPGEIKTDKLTNNIHSILTITDQFLPDAELVKATEKLW